MTIPEDNKRALLLNGVSSRLWKRLKKVISRALGTGGCLVIPYVTNGAIHYDIVSQDRLNINSKSGDKITSATILSDVTTMGNETYYRWTTYRLEGNNCIVEHKTTNSSGVDKFVPIWADINDVIISGVDRLPFAYLKSPVDNRTTSDDYGVPITYGCDSILAEIKECMIDIRKEFKRKRVRLQVDERMFTKNSKGELIVKDDLFLASPNAKNDNMFNIFDPAIRDSSYYNRLFSLFEILEKQIGTSRGIVTRTESNGATATEIKTNNGDTFAIVSDIREDLAEFWDDFLYSCNVLANCFNLSPMGEYTVDFDWSYNLIESSTETWQQRKDGQSMGLFGKAENRAWLTGESIEDAQKAVDEIAAREPSVATLLTNAE